MTFAKQKVVTRKFVKGKDSRQKNLVVVGVLKNQNTKQIKSCFVRIVKGGKTMINDKDLFNNSLLNLIKLFEELEENNTNEEKEIPES